MQRRSSHDDFEKEIKSHLDLEAEEQSRTDVANSEAERRARIAFGNVRQVSEDVRSVYRSRAVEDAWQDVRFGARVLRKNPGFTIVAALTLALGIGANTAIFSVIEAVMLRALPFSDSDQLVRIYSTKDGVLIGGNRNPGGPSAMDVQDFARGNHTFQQMVEYDHWRKNVSFGEGRAEPEQMRIGLVPAAYFQVLKIQPVMGRLFTAEECQTGKNYVAAISAQLWKTRFDSDPSILGRKIRINDELYTIVAVMPDIVPPWMEGHSGGDASAIHVWTPFVDTNSFTEAARGDRGDFALGRMKPGVTLEQAQADLAVIASQLAATYPIDHGIGVRIERLSDTRVTNLRPMLYLLTAAVGLILLIACVNLANLLLARNTVRERELALRGALGAERGRLVRQLLVETLLLALVGGGLGLVFAQAGVGALKAMQPERLPQLASIGVDWRVIAFTAAVALLTSAIFGLGPALAGTRMNLVETLKLGTRSGTSGTSTQRMRSALVIVEMAMSLMLLVAASLLVQSILRLERQQLGIRQDHVLKGHFYIPPVRYTDVGAITRFSDQFGDKVRALPGVVDASVTTLFPPDNGWTQMLGIPGHPATRIQDVPTAQFGVTDTHFLRTLGIPLLRGRDFADSDSATSLPVALINSEFERRYFANQDVIGQRVHIGPPAFLQLPPGANISDSADVTIVGVVANFKNAGLSLPPEPQIICLYTQHPLVNYSFKDIVVRTATEPHAMIPAIARELHSIDADMPFAQTQTIDELVATDAGDQRFTALLLGLFAAVGLALAAVGIYGVVSFLVSQRRRELAIRAAVGASVENLLWLVLGSGLRMALAGAAIGLAGAFAAQKLIRGVLFEISAVDPLTFVGAAAFLLAVVLFACWLPAWRSARVDPSLVLRTE